MKWFDAARTRLRLLVQRTDAESRMSREIRFHIDMETDRLVSVQRLTPEEARRQALAAFGGVEKHKEALRDGRGFAWLAGLSLNLKLGGRMLARYPAVTIVGGLAMTIGIGLGAAYLEGVNDFLHPRLPFKDGDRIIGLQNWDVAENERELQSSHDYTTWRSELRSIENLSAFRSIERNLGAPSVSPEPAYGAEITPSAFAAVGVLPLLGRTLVDADAVDGASPAVVLGHDLWRNRFAADAGILGETITLGTSRAAIVGVMPEGFAFPVSHQFWIALPSNALAHGPRQGPNIQIFGTLAAGATLQEAQAELSALGARAATDSPQTHQHLRPRVMKYTDLFIADDDNWRAYFGEFIFVMLLLVLGSNVATMVFARTATRTNEITMRFALGASRGQVLTQFFFEALVLALVAAAAALLAVSWSTGLATAFMWEMTEGRVPFWLDSRLNATTILFALMLAVIVSLLAGVVPALKATASGLQGRLRLSTGQSSLRFGGLWSAIIVVQVVFTVLVLPPAVVAVGSLLEPNHTDPGFLASERLSAHLELEGSFARFESVRAELRRQVLADPAISRVTFASRLPNMSHPEQYVHVPAEGDAPGASGELATAAAVDADFFAAFGAQVVAGRTFTTGDIEAGRKVVVVNEDFVKEVLQGRNALGRRLQYSNRYNERAATGQPRGLARSEMLTTGAWYEIVGVVRNLGMDTTKDAFTSGDGPGIYHPLTQDAMGSADSYAVRMAFHVRGDPQAFTTQFRTAAHAVDPALRLYDVLRMDGALDQISRNQRRLGRIASAVTALVALIALLISIAGTYSVMSFTVSRQTREIGIRIALGADRRRIVAGVFSRAMIQIAIGVVLGAVLWFYVLVIELGGRNADGLLAASGAILFVVGVLACGVPVRRALRIEPIQALRDAG
ncbi:MAG: ABC transporter permease [Acidobacteriota bacterium]|nr:ABC transporter permease [Acidobacteriota bacterium]